MHTSSEKTRYLLDKNVIRRAIVARRNGRLRSLTPEELGVLAFWRAIEQDQGTLLISSAAFHLLEHLSPSVEVQVVLDSMGVLWPTQYHKRWARRIRDTTGLTSEDSAQIALASFGADTEMAFLGAHYLVTLDQALMAGYRGHLPALNRRLQAMIVQLESPYDRAVLPRIVAPTEFLAGRRRLLLS